MTIYKTSFPDIDPSTLPEQGVFEYLFLNNKMIKPNNVALVDAVTGKELKYRELISDALCYGRGMIEIAGLKPFDTVLIFAPNSVFYAVLLFATQAAGIVATTANSGYTPPELEHQIHESSAKAIVVGSDLAPTAVEAAKKAGLPLDKIFVIPGVDGKVKVPEGCKNFEQLKGKEGWKPFKVPKDKLKTSPAFLPFSSGTTSRPKGVQVSHYNITSVSEQLRKVPDLFDKPEVCMGCLPLFHIYGLIVSLIVTLSRGGKVVLLPRFDLVVYLEAVQKHKATIGLVVPPIVLGLAKHPIVDKYDLSSLRFVLSGAAPLSSELQELLEKRLKGKTMVVQGYGMTETTSIGLLPDLEDRKAGSCGKLLPGLEGRLVNEEMKDVREGERGELILRGPNIMLRYHNNEKATKETFTDDGWMRTGDVCVRSKEGHYTIVDRVKELIKYKGFQVPPAELEGVLLDCPLVADAAVIGIHSEEQQTELPRAYVVPDPQHAKDKDLPKKIADYVAGKVANHKKLRGGVILMDVIPKSASGKILRKDLRVLAAKESGKSKL